MRSKEAGRSGRYCLPCLFLRNTANILFFTFMLYGRAHTVILFSGFKLVIQFPCYPHGRWITESGFAKKTGSPVFMGFQHSNKAVERIRPDGNVFPANASNKDCIEDPLATYCLGLHHQRDPDDRIHSNNERKSTLGYTSSSPPKVAFKI